MEDRIKEIFQENFKLNEANHQLKLNYILDKQSDLKKDDLSDSNTKMYNKISIVVHSFSELIIKLFGLYQKETNKSYFNKESSNRNLCMSKSLLNDLSSNILSIISNFENIEQKLKNNNEKIFDVFKNSNISIIK